MAIKISSRGPKLAETIRDRVEFNTYGALRGRFLSIDHELGILPPEYRKQIDADWKQAEEAGDELYVVFSYETPIAWYTTEGAWLVPDVRYTPTTSQHQGTLYLAQPRAEREGYRV